MKMIEIMKSRSEKFIKSLLSELNSIMEYRIEIKLLKLFSISKSTSKSTKLEARADVRARPRL